MTMNDLEGEQMPVGPWAMKTVSGYPADEVISSIQKCIRRGMSDDALFFVTEANASGLGAWVWRRLMITASEDVGMADPQAAVVVNSLYQISLVLLAHAKTVKKAGEKTLWPSLMLLEAAWYLSRAPKSRELAAAECTLIITRHHGELVPVRDWARDQHTASGRAMGRGGLHFGDPSFGKDGGAWIENHVEIDGDAWSKRFYTVWPPVPYSGRGLL
jgi:replication-associated recombination protein RarA